MHAFEDLVGRLVRRDGYWVRHSVKVDLTKDEKGALGQPSLPRPELDLVAYRPSDNVLALIECKSFLDSNGVNIKAFDGTDPEKPVGTGCSPTSISGPWSPGSCWSAWWRREPCRRTRTSGTGWSPAR
jgi:hypothetical protein